ncbi:MAG: molybdopterin-dependent oxidoreductase [Celeribacter sp.]
MIHRKIYLLAASAALIGATVILGEALTPATAQAEDASATTTSSQSMTATETAATPAPILLTVSDGTRSLTFDRAALEALPRTQIETSTIWTEGMQRFDGVSLKDLLTHAEVSSGTLQATAINDYSVTIPVSDAVEDGPIIAYLANDAPMSRRDKGPLWIVYPYDDNPDYQAETIYSRSIWQLDRLIVE